MVSGSMFEIIIVNHLERNEDDHGEKTRADEFGAALHDHPAAGARPGPLKNLASGQFGTILI
jgi:hypothetical protein